MVKKQDAILMKRKEIEWAPRVWVGMRASGWLRLLFKNRFAIDLSLLYIAVIDSLFSFINSGLFWIKTLFYHRKIKTIQIKKPPVFIIGHWRTGTTLLQEVLNLDPRFTAPNYYQCLEPNHFLLTEKFLADHLSFFTPTRRLIDNMPVNLASPLEDEFALSLLGVPSPYWTLAFPNRPMQFRKYFDLEGLTPKELSKWKACWILFLKEVYYKSPGNLLLKSPTHTWRIKTILEIFPNAKFIHIFRNPYVVFSSTVNLWKTLYEAQGLQKPTFEGLEDEVFSTFLWMHQQLERTKPLVNSENFYEIRYEDFIEDPLTQIERLYSSLQLEDFESLRPLIQRYFLERKTYQTNRYSLDQVSIQKINQHWGTIIKKQGYELLP
jgi:hypothetical protein